MKQHTIVLSVCMVMALLLAACNGTGSKKGIQSDGASL